MKFLALILVFVTTTAFAKSDEIRYEYLGLSFQSAKIDNVSDNAEGFAIDGEIFINPIFLLNVGYTSAKVESIDVTGTVIGIDYVHTLQPGADALIGISHVDAKISGGGISAKDTSISTDLGLRMHFSKNFQSEVEISLIEGDVTIGADLQLFLNEKMGIYVGATQAEDVDSLFFGVRIYK